MFEVRDPRHRRPWLALAARAQQNDLFPLQILELLLIEPSEILGQITGFDRHLNHTVQSPAGHDQPPARPPRCLGARLDARNVRGERRHHDAEGSLRDDLRDAFGDIRLARTFAIPHGVGGVAHQPEHALVADRRQSRCVGGFADIGRTIELPVSRMIDRPERCSNDKPARLRHRVRDADQFHIEASGLEAAVERHDLHRHIAPAAIVGHF